MGPDRCVGDCWERRVVSRRRDAAWQGSAWGTLTVELAFSNGSADMFVFRRWVR
jgi:hypothetical protein